jgi:hypothetical protein
MSLDNLHAFGKFATFKRLLSELADLPKAVVARNVVCFGRGDQANQSLNLFI